MAIQNEPLTEADLDNINGRLSDLDRADLIIERSARAGIDMSDQRKRSAELRGQLLKMKQSFFPGR